MHKLFKLGCDAPSRDRGKIIQNRHHCRNNIKLHASNAITLHRNVKSEPGRECLSLDTKKDNKIKTGGCKKRGRKKNVLLQNCVGCKLKCFYFNARSIINKRDELELYVFQENPDIIGITETWATDSIGDSELNLDGYTMLRKDRVPGVKLKGGGVLLYIKNIFNVVLREDFSSTNFPESIWCDLEIGGEKTLVGVCYRPPDSNRIQDEAMFGDFCRASNEKVLIMGDFNFADLDWSKPETLDDSHSLINCLNDNFLVQCVDSATRGTNYLDLIFVSEENMIENLVVGELFDTSDHQIIRWNFVACKENIKTVDNKPIHNYFKADYEKIREEATLMDWSEIVKGEDCNADFDRFKSALLTIRNQWVPCKKSNNSKCKWVNRGVIKCRRAKFKAWAKYKEDKSQVNFDRYKNKLQKSRNKNREAKRSYENKLANNIKNDCKSFFAYVRSKQRTKDKVGPMKDSTGRIIVEDEEAANLLNDYFSSVFTIEDCSNIPEPVSFFDRSLLGEGLIGIEVTDEIVENKLKNLNVNKCPGLDGVHPKMLFELRQIVAKPLARLYRCSLDSGLVPKEWKEAGVTPLFKKGTKSDAQNYRPVSLTSIVCKTMEAILKDAILAHLDRFSLIRTSQHGFTKGRSCLTNLLEFLDTVTSKLDEGEPVDVIYLDFAKAFDKVPYQRLFKK